jgi:hypothetical protein
MKHSPDAAAIMSLPAARHPKLNALCKRLSEHPKMTVEDAFPIIEAAAKDLRISGLEIEMIQPGNSTRVPFAPSIATTPKEDFEESINGHVKTLLGGRR